MNVVLGVISIAIGLYLITQRQREAARVVRARNRTFERLRLRRRYGERELRHNVRANVIVGAFALVLGVLFLTDVSFP